MTGQTPRTPEQLATRQGVAVGVATAAYGVSFGALAVAAGLDVWQACVLSLFMFTGGSQFALVGVLATGGLASAPAAIASAVMLGSRNAAYGMRMKPVVGRGWPRDIAAAWLTIDESVAVALAQKTASASRTGFWVTGLIVYIGWNLTTLGGALIGDLLGDTRAYGLDAAAAAAFLGLLWPRLRRRQALVVAGGAMVIAAVLLPFAPSGVPVVAAAAVAIVVGVTNWFASAEPRGRIL